MASTRAFRLEPTAGNCFYPRRLGTRGAVATQHHLSAIAAADILKGGGNAIDGAVAAVLVEGVVNPQMHTIGGECPMLIRMAGSAAVVAINGNTAAPLRADAAAYRRRGLDAVPDEGILAAGVPATLGALVTALARFGTMRFAEVAAAATGLARDGFPMHRGLLAQEKFGISALAEKFRLVWPGSAALYLPEGRPPAEGELFCNPALAGMLEALAHSERAAMGDRRRGLDAVADAFYRGEVAAEIARFSAARDGLLEGADLARFETRLEDPVALDFRGARLFKCGPWNQGPAMLQALAILDRFDLQAMGHNSTAYIHHVVEAIKLAFADREQYLGDPLQVAVPIDELLSAEYAALRARLIDPGEANPELRPGDPRNRRAVLPVDERLGGKAWGPGTVHVDVIDRHGNTVSATPSGAWIRSAEVIPSLGFPLGNRLMTFYLEPAHHPNLVAPGRRPRTTISPSLAWRGGERWMAFGSMGGDQQDQWQLQFALNSLVFGMTLQQAIEAPKFSSEHFPGFFAPHGFHANRLRIEPRVAPETLAGLARLGHDLEIAADWSEGYLLAAARDGATGVLEAGADPRGAKGEVFPACALAW